LKMIKLLILLVIILFATLAPAEIYNLVMQKAQVIKNYRQL